MDKKEMAALIEAAKQLKEYCQRKDVCTGCIFYSDSDGCSLCVTTPNVWKIPTLPRWTERDKALAKALKEFGVFEIYRKNNGNIRYKGHCEGIPDAEYDDWVPSYIFSELQPDETISLDDIINEGVKDHEKNQ